MFIQPNTKLFASWNMFYNRTIQSTNLNVHAPCILRYPILTSLYASRRHLLGLYLMCQAQESNKMLANSSTDTNLAFDKARCHRELFYCSLFLMGCWACGGGRWQSLRQSNDRIFSSYHFDSVSLSSPRCKKEKGKDRDIKKKKTDFVLCHQVHEDHLSLFWGDK